MSKHRDFGVDMPKPTAFAYLDNAGNLYRAGYEPYGRVVRAEYGLQPTAVESGTPFGMNEA